MYDAHFRHFEEKCLFITDGDEFVDRFLELTVSNRCELVLVTLYLIC